MAEFHVAHLDEGEIDKAFALIRSSNPNVPLTRWRSFTSGLLGAAAGRAGAIGVHNSAGYLHGLCTYHVTEDLSHYRVLVAQNVVALDILGGRDAAHALRRELESTARAFQCYAVHLMHDVRDGVEVRHAQPLYRVFVDHGHRVDAVRTSKILTASTE